MVVSHKKNQKGGFWVTLDLKLEGGKRRLSTQFERGFTNSPRKKEGTERRIPLFGHDPMREGEVVSV